MRPTSARKLRPYSPILGWRAAARMDHDTYSALIAMWVALFVMLWLGRK
jgi:hypothetical protein